MILLLACAPSKFFSFYRVDDHKKCIMQSEHKSTSILNAENDMWKVLI